MNSLKTFAKLKKKSELANKVKEKMSFLYKKVSFS